MRVYRALIAIASALLLVPYGIYQVAHYYYNVDLDRMYFITQASSAIIVFFVLYQCFNDRFIQTVTIIVVSFFTILLAAYIGSGLILGMSYIYIKISLLIGFFIGLIYFLYDYFTGFKS